jgi:cellobiose phosphorylase
VESLLGVSREGARLRIAPCLPPGWPGFKLRYRYGETIYRIEVTRDESGDAEQVIDLIDDRQEHLVELRIRAHPSA